MTPTRHPLTWPEGWKRTPSSERKKATFSQYDKRLTVMVGISRVMSQLEKLGVQADDVIVSTNLRTRMDGLPRGNEPKPADCGVAVYWQKSDREPMRCMAVDRYDEVADNLAAIAATLDALRAIERHGGAAILDRAFTGFAALPAPAAGRRDWWTVLELSSMATAADIEAAHRRLRSLHHPDRGGDAALMAEINAARDEALKSING